MNSKQRRAAKRVGVQRGFGPRHAFNAQEGSEAVPSELPTPPGAPLDFMDRARRALIDQVLPPELREEIRRNPTGARALATYANLGIMLMPGHEGGAPRGVPKSGKVSESGARYEGPPPSATETGVDKHWSDYEKASGFDEGIHKEPLQHYTDALDKYANGEPLKPHELQLIQDIESVMPNPNKELMDKQFPSLNKPPYDALKEVPPEGPPLQSREAPSDPGWEQYYDFPKFEPINPEDIPPRSKKGSSKDYDEWKAKHKKEHPEAYPGEFPPEGDPLDFGGPSKLDAEREAIRHEKPPEPPYDFMTGRNWDDLIPPRFKKGTTGVRHNPKTKTGRPKKIGVEKGYGPRHAANAKEGQDLTEINTDTVPAMLTPREAVLNRNAAELAGRDKIEALNQEGNALARKGVDLAAEGMSDVKERIMKSKQSKPKSGSPYVQGFEAQKAKGYEGGVAKLPKPAESVGGLQTPQGYTNTNKWGNPYGWNPGTPPQLGGGPDPRGSGPFPEPPGGVLGHPGGQTDPGYVAKMPPGVLGQPGGGVLGKPGGSQNVNQYGVAYGWNPGGGASLGGGQPGVLGQPGGGVLGKPGGWTAQPAPLKSGGLYPPGQGIFHGATGASDILGEGESIYGNSSPVNLSAPGGLAEMVAALKKEASKQGLSSDQIAALTKAFSSFGGGGGYANQSLSAGEDFGNPNYIGLGTPSYQGGISEVGYPPGIAPRAAFSYEEGGWTGPLDPRWSSPGYQGGTSGVPGLYRGENDFRGGGSTSAGGGVGFHGGHDWNPNNFPPEFPPANIHDDPADFFQDPQVMNIQQFRGQPGFPWSPTMLQTTYNPQGYPRAVLAGPDWNKSGPGAHTPRKNRS